MTKALYPGSFDPLTFGHLDIIERAAALFGDLVVGVGINPQKRWLLPPDERVQLIQELVPDRVEVLTFSGLLVDFARDRGVTCVVRGLRNATDFDYEFSMTSTNRTLQPDLETVFLMPPPRWSFLSSSLVRQVAAAGSDVSDLVPEPFVKALQRQNDSPKETT